MTLFIRIIFCLMFLGLSSCVYQSHNEVRVKNLSQCLMTCVQHVETCKQNCTDNCQNCTVEASNTAAEHFFRYVNDKQIQGGTIDRSLKSYRDPLQCRKVSCNCTSDYITCKQSCTGVVQKRLQPLPYCP